MSMTHDELLRSACALLNESTEEVPADYLERAAYLLGSYYAQCESLDLGYRAAHGMTERTSALPTVADMDGDFLFVPALAPAAVYYLAAMLVMDENEVLGDKLYDLYVDAVSSTEAALPFSKESIREVY